MLTGVTAAASFWKKKRCFFIQKSVMDFKGLASVRCLEREKRGTFGRVIRGWGLFGAILGVYRGLSLMFID